MVGILILGGYGAFGHRIARRLAGRPGIEVIIAGRNQHQATTLARTLCSTIDDAQQGAPRVVPAHLDAESLTPSALQALGARVLINTVGPFQGRDYRVAEAAMSAGMHYIDLADARSFVTGVTGLDAEARRKDVLVTSGASSVPALAAAVIDEMVPRIPALDTLRYGISPGNRFDPGPATTASILSGIGRPFRRREASRTETGGWQTEYGWQPLMRATVSGVGTRWYGHCDVPDLALFPERYPTLRSQSFLAGVEVRGFHLALFALSWLARTGVLPHPEGMAPILQWAKRRLSFLASDTGVMFIDATGRDTEGRPAHRRWTLVAPHGLGPFIPATPAVIIAERLARGTLTTRGAVPCVGLFTLAEFEAEVADLPLQHRMEEVTAHGD